MPILHIDDPSDERLDAYRDLQNRAREKNSELFIAESRLVVGRLLDSSFEIDSLLCSQRERAALDHLATSRPDLPIYTLASETLHALIGFKLHQGQLACARRPRNVSIEQWLAEDARNIVVCPHVTDPVNLAGVIRNCAAFDVDGLLLGPACTAPFSRRTVRVSMGTIFSQSIRISKDLRQDLLQLKHGGFELMATVLDENAEPLNQTRRPNKFALLFGSEGPGLSEEWIELCERRLTIPMQRKTDSLNLATATGIFLYELTSD